MTQKPPEDRLKVLGQQPRSERTKVLFGFSAFGYQQELLDKDGQVQSAVKPGRQVGKTVTGGAIAADEGITGSDVMILAPYQDTVDEMMEACRGHIDTAEQRLAGTEYSIGIESRKKREITFKDAVGGGRIRARTVGSDGTQIRGKNPNVVLVDEAAYIKDSIYTEVIEPFFSTHDEYKFYLFSTPAGKSGYFYEKVVNDDNWFSPHWPSKISPLIDESFLKDKERELDSLTFAQEYLGQFVDDGDSYLPYDLVEPCVNPDVHKQKAIPRWLGVDPAERGKDRMVITDIDTNGVIHNIWSKETVTGPEFVGLLTDLQTGETVPQADTGTNQLPTHGYEQIVVESNMAGLATDIAQSGLGNVITPVKSTVKSKGPMYKRLKRDMEAQEITIPNYRRLTNQLTRLKYTYTANQHLKISHPDGGHDDYPDSLMLANAGRVGLADRYSTDMEGQKQKASATWGW